MLSSGEWLMCELYTFRIVDSDLYVFNFFLITFWNKIMLTDIFYIIFYITVEGNSYKDINNNPKIYEKPYFKH